MDRFKGGLDYDLDSQLVVHKFESIEYHVEAAIEVEKSNNVKNSFILRVMQPLTHSDGIRTSNSIGPMRICPFRRLS